MEIVEFYKKNQGLIWFWLVFAAGMTLRWMWLGDMEWKYDEATFFERSQRDGRLTPWPPLGMESGVGLSNPGFHLWIFIALGHFLHDPLSLVRAVTAMHTLAFLGFIWFAFNKIPKERREVWLWGLSIALVTPLSILYSRKNWTLPPFLFLSFLGIYHRQKRWGAFLWGLMGGLMGQIHMSGFFYAAGLLIWTLYTHWKDKTLKAVKWGFWFMGSICAAIPLIPWVIAMLNHYKTNPAPTSAAKLFQFKFYFEWLGDALGLYTKYTFHGQFKHFIKEPFIGSTPTYFVGILHLVIAICFLWGCFLWFKKKELRVNAPEATFMIKAFAIATGILFTISMINIHPHYLIILFPFHYIWVAVVLLPHRKLLMMIVAAQFLISLNMMTYIHRNGGIPGGDYGDSYRLQNYPLDNYKNRTWHPGTYKRSIK